MSPLSLFLSQLVLAQSYEMDGIIIILLSCVFLKVKSLGWRNFVSYLNTVLVWLSLRRPPFCGHRVGCNTNWSPQKHAPLILNFKWLWELLDIFAYCTLKTVTWIPGTYPGFCDFWDWSPSFYFNSWATSYLSNIFHCFHLVLHCCLLGWEGWQALEKRTVPCCQGWFCWFQACPGKANVVELFVLGKGRFEWPCTDTRLDFPSTSWQRWSKAFHPIILCH